MSFLSAKAPGSVLVPNPADLVNRLNNQRGQRLAQSGRNSTFLGAAVDSARAGPKATLTGLQG
jgi:hypothetical protein